MARTASNFHNDKAISLQDLRSGDRNRRPTVSRKANPNHCSYYTTVTREAKQSNRRGGAIVIKAGNSLVPGKWGGACLKAAGLGDGSDPGHPLKHRRRRRGGHSLLPRRRPDLEAGSGGWSGGDAKKSQGEVRKRVLLS